MTLSIVIAIFLLLASECSVCDMDTFHLITSEFGLRVMLIEDGDSYPPYLINIPYKYVLGFSLLIFAVALLFYLEALKAPYVQSFAKFLGNMDKPNDDNMR